MGSHQKGSFVIPGMVREDYALLGSLRQHGRPNLNPLEYPVIIR
jgi:hypothetical protein